jgi:TonB family protein
MPRSFKFRFLAAALLALSLAAPAAARGGQALDARQAAFDEQVERGRQLYLRGDSRGAVAVLREAVKARKDAAEAWYYLGLALVAEDEPKEARKSFERALKLRPDFTPARAGLAYALAASNKFSDARREARRVIEADPQQKDAHFVLGTVALRNNDFEGALREAELALRADAEYSPALLLKTQALISAVLGSGYREEPPPSDVRAARLREAEESLERVLRLNPESVHAAAWREQLEAVRIYTGLYDAAKPDRLVFRSSEVTERAVIHARPEPGFTEAARQNNTQGLVRVRLVLSADGTVKHILVVRGLPHGLTEQAVNAARRIRFTPATKDGRPVSTVVTVEYNFHIH